MGVLLHCFYAQEKQQKPIHFAAHNGKVNIVRKLLSLKVDVECVDYVSNCIYDVKHITVLFLLTSNCIILKFVRKSNLLKNSQGVKK